MSEANVEIARAGIDALSETYRTRETEAWAQQVERVCDPEIVLETGTGAFTEGEWRGREGAVGFVANQMEVLEEMWIEADEIIDAGDDRVVVLIRFGGRARHTGIAVELAPGHIFDFRDGLVVRWRVFAQHDEALGAAGLAE